MSFGFKSVEHALSTVARDVAKGFAVVVKEAPVVEPVVEGVTAVLDPPALSVERAAFATLGTVLAELQKTGTDASGAVAAKGLSVSFDTATVTDLKGVLATCEGVLQKLGVLPAAKSGN